MSKSDLRFRAAQQADAFAVAGLHADSWQRHYRGAYADAFLDEEAADYLGAMWHERLAAPAPGAHTVLAERDGELVGLVHTVLDADPTWGALLDNLHVRHGLKRQRIGTALMARSAQAVLRGAAMPCLHLWVLEQNSAARAFYAARGGVCVEADDVPPPGGKAVRLSGKPIGLRYVWRDPSVLLAAAGPYGVDVP
jgi:ribosomal protein S18 acetylase RimI-like enzyme